MAISHIRTAQVGEGHFLFPAQFNLEEHLEPVLKRAGGKKTIKTVLLQKFSEGKTGGRTVRVGKPMTTDDSVTKKTSPKNARPKKIK